MVTEPDRSNIGSRGFNTQVCGSQANVFCSEFSFRLVLTSTVRAEQHVGNLELV